MKPNRLLWWLPVVLLGCFAAAGPSRAVPSPLPAGASGFAADKGKFRILLQGNEVGSEEFDLQPAGNGWVIRAETVIRVSGSPEMRTSGELRLSADGVPQHYSWSTEGGKQASGAVEFDSGTAKTSINISRSKEPFLRDFKFTSPHVAVLDNNLHEQYAILGRIYDWNAKGTQTFPVIIPQAATPGSIQVESLGPQTVEGKRLEALQVHSTDLEIELYFDAKFRLIRVDVPSAKVVITRQ